MDPIRLTQIMGRIPPETWDAIHPHSHRPQQRSRSGWLTPAGGTVAMNPQPLPPRDEVLGGAVEMTRAVAQVALAAEGTLDGGIDVLDRFVDDFCGSVWPRWWPFPHPTGADGFDEEWDVAGSRVASALVLASMAGRLGDVRLRDALAGAADKLLEAAAKD